MKNIGIVLFCLLAIDQILCHSIQPRLIGNVIENDNDKEKNTVAFMNADSKIICSGAFIHSQWILTAAWCTKKLTINSRYVFSENLADDFAKANLVDNVIPHPQFNSVTLVNNIALVRIAAPVDKKVTPLLIPKENKVLTNLKLKVRGLGLVGFDGAAATKLSEQEVEIRDNKNYCSKYGPMPLNTICSRHSIGCLGDTGGPLIQDGTYIWGIMCMNDDTAEMCGRSIAQPKPLTVYTLIVPNRAWIQKTTGLNL